MFRSSDISYSILSLGCSKNLVDSERVNGAMEAAGFSQADSPREANIVIINTCGFITQAKEESIEVIFDALDDISAGTAVFTDTAISAGTAGRCVPGKDFGRRVAVMGCLTSRYIHEIKNGIPEVDFVYGIPDERFVPGLCRALSIQPSGRARGGRKPLMEGLSHAYIKIAEGCSNRCSYCAIPLIRGRARSLAPAFILRDARNAASRGAVEMNIVAQDIAVYRHGTYRLDDLVARIAGIRTVRWIRLLYCHPDHCGKGIIDLLAKGGKVVRYLDLPFQHASGRILRAMGRKGDGDIYLKLVERLRAAVPGIRLRSTFMVGFPGEREADFTELKDFLSIAKIDRAGAFMYSSEDGTAAAEMRGQVDGKVKRRRLTALMTLQQKISAAAHVAMIGSTVDVLVEERLDRETFIGRTEFDAPEVDGIFYLTAREADLKTIIRARVTGATEYDLMGEPA